MQNTNLNFIFFGTDPLAKVVLETLKSGGFLPILIVAGQDYVDKKNNVIFPTEKNWAIENNIPTIQPQKITSLVIEELEKLNPELFIVASYGKILSEKLLALPKYGTLNLHPSLLPELRGPSPMRSAILNDKKETGVSIMLLDKEMDHGPIFAQKKIVVEPWPILGKKLDEILAKEGAKLLLELLPKIIAGEIEPKEQNHSLATYCKEFSKTDGLIDLSNDPYQNYLKICAFEGWPGTYFFVKKNDRDIRVKITEADFEDGKLIIKKVIPEGKKEMLYSDFQKRL